MQLTPEALRRTEQRAVVLQLERLMGYPMVRERVEAGQLTLHGWHYVIEDGEVHVFDVRSGGFVAASQRRAQRHRAVSAPRRGRAGRLRAAPVGRAVRVCQTCISHDIAAVQHPPRSLASRRRRRAGRRPTTPPARPTARRCFLMHGFPYDIHAYAEVAPPLAARGCRVDRALPARLRPDALPDATTRRARASRRRWATTCWR